MIGYIKGKVINSNAHSVIVITETGVGYLINKLANLAFLDNEACELYIYTLVRESELSLWGFKDRSELAMFTYLISVSGVGPKTAMLLIAEKGIFTILDSIIKDDFKSLKVSGVGEKTAQKIILDLKSKLQKDSANFVKYIESNSNSKTISKEDSIYLDDAISALIQLGYKESDIKDAYNLINLEGGAKLLESSKDLIKALLRNIK